jgi:hypothetical protein
MSGWVGPSVLPVRPFTHAAELQVLQLQAEQHRQHIAARRAAERQQANRLAQVEAQALEAARAAIEGRPLSGGAAGADADERMSLDGGRTTRENSDDEMQVRLCGLDLRVPAFQSCSLYLVPCFGNNVFCFLCFLCFVLVCLGLFCF